jgi:hypothetical protein
VARGNAEVIDHAATTVVAAEYGADDGGVSEGNPGQPGIAVEHTRDALLGIALGQTHALGTRPKATNFRIVAGKKLA